MAGGHERAKPHPQAQHVEHAGNDSNISGSDGLEHEAELAGTIALANLFSNCVEAFQLIHPVHRWDRDEQQLLCRLGIEQARLLIWGDVVGISSPPASVTDRAIPKHPSSVYPDLSEPTFFQARDARLDEHETRSAVEAALSAIVDRSAAATREEMMEKYGLRPPKRTATDIFQPALDNNRLEAFREHFELLKEVAESYAHLGGHARRNNSITHTSWTIAHAGKFDNFIQLTQEKVNELISLFGVSERVDRAMRMDIKAIGWHLTFDRGRIAADRATLRLVHLACKDVYPAYLPAIEIALANVETEWNESIAAFNALAPARVARPVAGRNASHPTTAAAKSGGAKPGGAANGHGVVNGGHGKPGSAAAGSTASQHKGSHGGLFGGLFKSRGKKSSTSGAGAAASNNVTSSGPTGRSLSDSGPSTRGPPGGQDEHGMEDAEFGHSLQPVRSKSVGALIYPGDDDDEDEHGHEAGNGVVPPPAAAVEALPVPATVTAITQSTAPAPQPPAAAAMPITIPQPPLPSSATAPIPIIPTSISAATDFGSPPTDPNAPITAVPLDFSDLTLNATPNNAEVAAPSDVGTTGEVPQAEIPIQRTVSNDTDVTADDLPSGSYPDQERKLDDVGLAGMISRHDMYRGLGRQGTKNQ